MLRGDEEQNGKQKKETERVSNLGTLNHSVTYYNAQELYSEPICFTHPAIKRGILSAENPS